MAADPTAGQPAAFDGASGSFTVGPSPATRPDFRARGRLHYVGEHYLRFAGSGEASSRAAPTAPRTCSAYADFDADRRQRPQRGVSGLHLRAPRRRLAGRRSDWHGGPGQGPHRRPQLPLRPGMNSVYFLTMNVTGDGDDVWPWTGDASVFASTSASWTSGRSSSTTWTARASCCTWSPRRPRTTSCWTAARSAPTRKLYYRELVARFAHHPAVVWNLGEENTNTTRSARLMPGSCAEYDPYDHPVVMRTTNSRPTPRRPTRRCLASNSLKAPRCRFAMTSWCTGSYWIGFGALARPAGRGPSPLTSSVWAATASHPMQMNYPEHNEDRHVQLWATLMAGGWGIEWYFGYQYEHNDVNLEDWRSRDVLWKQTLHATSFS